MATPRDLWQQAFEGSRVRGAEWSTMSGVPLEPAYGPADGTNWRFKEIIRSGGDGLSTAFDMPTLLGLDSDDPMSLGEVGRCGVAIDSLADMEDLYAGIDLGNITT